MISRRSGSETFETAIVKTDDFILLAQIMVENGSSTEEAYLQIMAIDDMLRLMQSVVLINKLKYTRTGRLRKNASLSDLIEGRINQLAEDLQMLKTQS